MFRFRVTPDNGEPFEVVAKGRDIAKWEKGGRGRAFGRFADEKNLSYTDLYSLAHTACLRQGLFHGPLNEFEETVDVELVDESGWEADPTRMAR